jgi:hypothetical protein
MSFSAGPSAQAAPPQAPAPIPPPISPGPKPKNKAIQNPTIIGAPSAKPLTLMGPGALGAGGFGAATLGGA